MKRLNTTKTRLDQELLELRQRTATNAVVTQAQYERLLAKLKKAIENEEN